MAKQKIISIRISDDMFENLERVSKSTNTSIPELIRSLIVVELDDLEGRLNRANVELNKKHTDN